MTRALRYTGWTLISAGAVVLLYVVYSLFFTSFATRAAQSDLSEEWDRQVEVQVAEAPDPEEDSDPPAVDPGGAFAVLEFSRPGTDERPVHADPLYIVSGVGMADLTRGPGHYPGTAEPGGEGNLAIAGHRTTYGAPFYHLDQMVEGDEIHVTGRDGERHTYRVARTEVVQPGDVWVVGSDPLETETPMLTLTTCHPRFSAAQRFVVFAELVT
ncbi:MAG: class E sortase [Egibacteraceae bacterium]